MPTWLTKLRKILGKIADVAIKGRAAGLWDKKPGPVYFSQPAGLTILAPEPWDPALSIRKGIMSLARMIGAAMITSLIGVLSDSQAIGHLFLNAGAPEYIAAALGMGAVALGKVIANAWSHFEEPKV